MNLANNVNLEKHLKNQDLTWSAIPYEWDEAPFTANGFYGCTAYFSKDNKKMIIALGHTCVYDNRPFDRELDESLIKFPRLPIGKVEISFSGTVTDVDLRLNMYDSEITGTVTTDKGKCHIRIIALNDCDCVIIEHTEENENVKIEYKKSHGCSPRVVGLRLLGENDFADYELPKGSYEKEIDDNTVFVQPYFTEGGFSMAYREVGNTFMIACAQNDKDFSFEQVASDILSNAFANKDELIASHRDWWHKFFEKSFVSFNDGLYENFYNIQLYKLACASRSNGQPFDTCGPWLTENTRWPAAWWNLNVELTSSPLYTSNHIDIAKCVSNTLSNSIDVLIDNVPEKYRKDCAALGRNTCKTLLAPVTEPGNLNHFNPYREGGNLIWALFYCYMEYRMTDNVALLKDTVYPLLKRAVKYYSYFLYTSEDNKLHLKATISPEYLKSDSDDVNYDLMLLIWGCLTLKEIIDILKIEDTDLKLWDNILDNLTDYPQDDKEGLKIAKDTPYAESHRHYSHILGFYPLHIIDRDKAEDRDLIERTIDFWQSKPEALQGYSQTGAASMRAMMRDGNKALHHLDKLMCGFIRPNTMYHEDRNPVLETPPSAATAILEMFVQSHDGYIEFFPAVPDKWENVCFDNLLCYDGFEVSAERRNGKLVWLKVKSLFGKECKIKADFCGKDIITDGKYDFENGFYTLSLNAEEEIILSTEENISVHTVVADKQNCFGLK